MGRTNLKVGLLLLLGSSLAATSISGQDHPNHARGFGGGTFQGGEIDSVSLFSGSLSLTVPIGPLTLIYGSNVWDFRLRIDGGGFGTEAVPSSLWNSGLGWRLSLGELLDYRETGSGRWTYLGADGGSHAFYQQLHRGEDDQDPETWYTRDGSYLRLKRLYDSPHWRQIEFPDGSKHTFSTSGCQTCWVLTRIEDPFGNYLDVTYNSDKTLWTLTDRHGRTHKVHFQSMINLGKQVTLVDLQSVGGQRLHYRFNYQSVHVNRSCKDTYPGNNDRPKIPHLASIDLPDGSSFRMTDSSGALRYYNVCEDGIDDVPGVLRGLELPTRGVVEWEFQEYRFPASSSPYFDTAAGVKTRTAKRKDGTVEGTRTYATELIPPGGGPNDEVRTHVVYSTGDCTKHYFAAPLDLNANDWTGWEYGLPFTRRTEDSGRYLSSEVWTTSTAGGTCAGTKLRSTYLRFEHDRLPNSTAEADKAKWYATNRRVAERHVVYHDDGDRYKTTLSSDFDGLGHYRTVTTSGNYRDDSAAIDRKTVTTNYHRSPWTYHVNQATNAPCCGHDYQVLSSSVPWVLGIYDSVELSEPHAEGETTSRVEYDFDGTTGFLRAQRVLASGTTRRPNDVVQQYVEGPFGQVASARWYGGDVQSLPTGPGWSMPGQWIYRVDHTYEHGVRKTSQAARQDGTPMPFKLYDVDVDPASGVVLASRDPSGLLTAYTYDAAGRLQGIQPEEGAGTVYAYSVATTASPASIRITQRSNNGSAVLADQEHVFDDFGRLWKERQLQPGNGWVEKETLYNGRGWMVSVSRPDEPAARTQYLEFDPFGRPGRIRPPDTELDAKNGPIVDHDVRVVYAGDRVVRHFAKIGTAPGLETEVERRYLFDAQGRFRKVVEPSAAGGGSAATLLSYDVGDRMVEIRTHEVANPSLEQIRRFVYDNRGFLLEEAHPEKGASGNGSVYFAAYDPQGRFGQQVDGATDLRFTYDPAGRLARVDDHNGGTPRPIEEYLFDGAPGRGLGKTWQAIRHNYVVLPWSGGAEQDVTVMESYSYLGTAGQVSERLTNIAPRGYSFAQSFTWTDLGEIEDLRYPSCEHVGCPADEPSRTIRHVYTRGFLTKVGWLTGTITYHPNGMWKEIPHENGVSDHQERDPSGIARPFRFFTTGVGGGADFDTGTLAYDGSGNVTRIGSESFAYDGVGRLVQATAAGNTEQYAYDLFGNLTQFTRVYPDATTETRTVAVVPSTNRISMAAYDAAGNVTSWNGMAHRYDARNQLSRTATALSTRTHVYAADGLRIWTIDEPGGSAPATETISIRDLEGSLLRQYEATDGEWQWTVDNIFRDGDLLASVHGDTPRRHYHLDQLGTPRQVTDANGNRLYGHTYLPYGEEVTDPSQTSYAMRFTLHERDWNGPGSFDDLDYMRARYYSPHLGRFLQVDPKQGAPEFPQSLNRYSYVFGSPVIHVDPDGMKGSKRYNDYIEVVSSPLGLDTKPSRRDRGKGRRKKTKEEKRQEKCLQWRDVMDNYNPSATWKGGPVSNFFNQANYLLNPKTFATFMAFANHLVAQTQLNGVEFIAFGYFDSGVLMFTEPVRGERNSASARPPAGITVAFVIHSHYGDDEHLAGPDDGESAWYAKAPNFVVSRNGVVMVPVPGSLQEAEDGYPAYQGFYWSKHYLNVKKKFANKCASP